MLPTEQEYIMKEEVPDPADRISPNERARIKGLLKSKRSDSVTLGLSLLESLGATRADYEAVFTDRVIKAVLKTWDGATWAAVSRSLLPHEVLFGTFRRWAEKANAWCRRKRDQSFTGLAHAMIPAARVGFLAAWGKDADPKKPFIDLVEISAGAFTMGSPATEADRGDDEDQVDVRITNPFTMSRTVVTQRQWREVMGTEPWRHGGINRHSGDDFPAVCVSWDAAVLFCQTLTDLERESGRLTAMQSYRLPTEAEWEYACRAGTTTAYSFGDDPSLLDEYGWYGENADRMLRAVAGKKPNPWGLFDMHGNVWEWCADWIDDALAGGDDPVGPAVGSYRVGRGGLFANDARLCRSACRDGADTCYCDVYYGFRVIVAC